MNYQTSSWTRSTAVWSPSFRSSSSSRWTSSSADDCVTHATWLWGCSASAPRKVAWDSSSPASYWSSLPRSSSHTVLSLPFSHQILACSSSWSCPRWTMFYHLDCLFMWFFHPAIRFSRLRPLDFLVQWTILEMHENYSIDDLVQLMSLLCILPCSTILPSRLLVHVIFSSRHQILASILTTSSSSSGTVNGTFVPS